MKGAKRFVVPDSNQEANANDSALRNKRIMAGSPFDVHRAEPSQQQLTATPQLDVHRAESSRQHVRALNNQFASWVQTQLKNHPDELWEDGVRDYLTHASHVMDKFNDVVQWLKANASCDKTMSGTGSDAVEKKTVPEIKNNETKVVQGNSGFAPMGSTTGFGMSWASGGSSSAVSSQTSEVPPAKNNDIKPFQGKSLFPPISTTTSSVPSWNFGSSSSAVSSHISEVPPAKNNDIKPFQGKPLFPPISTTTSSVPSWNFGSSSFAVGSSAGEKPPVNNLFQGNSAFAPAGTTASFGTSWSSGVFSNSQTSSLFGNQSSAPANRDASEDADGENEVEEPGSPSVKKAEEKGIVVVHEVKCKLYVKSSDPADKDAWKDKGSGQLSIKCQEGVTKGAKDSKPIIIIRNDVGRILLNALIYPGIKTTINKNSIVAIFHTAGDGNGDDNSVIARTCLIRLKTEDDRNKLDATIKECAPAS